MKNRFIDMGFLIAGILIASFLWSKYEAKKIAKADAKGLTDNSTEPVMN